MTKSNAPVNAAATQEEELPQTAVKPRQKDLLLQQMQERLASYENNEEVNVQSNTPQNEEESTYKKRYGDLRRFQQQKEKEAQTSISELQSQINQLTVAQNQPLPKTREEFEAWKSRYPDIVGFIEIIAEERANAAKTQLSEELDTVRNKLTETEKEKAFATLKLLVPDLEEVLDCTPYKKWFNEQPHFVQDILNTSDDPHQIAYYINVYRTTIAPTNPASKASKLDALNTSVKNSGTTPSNQSGKWKFTQSQISKMSTQEFEDREDEIIAARNTGLILDDVSRKNSVFDI